MYEGNLDLIQNEKYLDFKDFLMMEDFNNSFVCQLDKFFYYN